jgi:hypothetical protein
MIRTERTSQARPAIVHELLVDIEAWKHWSPHVASVASDSRRVGPGWEGATRPFFAPFATTMTVGEVRADGGYRWHASLGPWRLDYDNLVEPAPAGSTLRFTAALQGPGAGWLERIVGPLSALGQRRRIRRLVELAELIDGLPPTPPRTPPAPPPTRSPTPSRTVVDDVDRGRPAGG